MKVLTKNEVSTILEVTESDIYLLTMALNTHAKERGDLHYNQCQYMIEKLNKAVYHGKSNSN